MSTVFTRDDLINLKPAKDTFVGIDSDGCVFDTMEVKQKKFFHAHIISKWHLEPIEKYLRESAEFVNLYSKKRGRNRFPCLVDAIDLLRDRPEVIDSEVELPEFKSLRKLIDSGIPLGNPTVKKAADETGDQELKYVLKWSEDLNADIAKNMGRIPPFKWARESIEKMQANSDIIVVSQTPTEALIKEWKENDIMKYVKVIAGQELGKKSEHLEMAAKGKYDSSKILMIGDAPGDRKAAEANNALFYPVNPGKETASWERFYNEAYDKFLAGEYEGAYQQKVIDEFEALLPEIPPWKK